MEIAIIDADLIGRKNHRFPNLACMKLSGQYKQQGAQVTLKQDYLDIDLYDKVFISKVFTDTPCPGEVLTLPKVSQKRVLKSQLLPIIQIILLDF